MNGEHCYFSSAPQSERLKGLSWSLHTCTSGELRLNDLLLWSSWANVTISAKLDIYDTLVQDQREKVSQTFSFQPSQAVKEIAAGWLSPHYTSSQWNAAFSLPGVTGRQLKATSYGPLPAAALLWEPGILLTAVPATLPHLGQPFTAHKAFVVSILLLQCFHESLIHSLIYLTHKCQLYGLCLPGGWYWCTIGSSLTSYYIYSAKPT